MNTKKLIRFINILILSLLIGSFAQAQNRASGNKINFTKFSVSTDKKGVLIGWATDNSQPTNYFEIQKSVDGINFKTIAIVLGPDPKQPSGDYYACYDKYIAKSAKHSYYRLKHINTNGTEQLSEAKLLAKI